MGTAVKHPVSDRIKPSFVIFDIRHSDAQVNGLMRITQLYLGVCWLTRVRWSHWRSHAICFVISM